MSVSQGSQGSILIFIPVEYPLNTQYKKSIVENVGIIAVKLPNYVIDIVICNQHSEMMDLLKEIEYYKAEQSITNRITVLEVQEKIYMSVFLYRYLYPYKIRDYSYLFILKENIHLHPLFNITSFIEIYNQLSYGVLSPSCKILEAPLMYPSTVNLGEIGIGMTPRDVAQIDIGFIMMNIDNYRKLYNILSTQVANQENGLEQSIYLTGLKLGVVDGFPMEVVPSVIKNENVEKEIEIVKKETNMCMSINYPLLQEQGFNIQNIPLGKSMNLREDMTLDELLSINLSVNSEMSTQLSISMGPNDICELWFLYEQFRNKKREDNSSQTADGPKRKYGDFDYGRDDDYHHHDYWRPWWHHRPWWWWHRHDNYPYWEHDSDNHLDYLEDRLYRSKLIKGQPYHKLGNPGKEMSMEFEMEMDSGIASCECVCMHRPSYPLPCLLSIPSQMSVSEIVTDTNMVSEPKTLTYWGWKGCHNFKALVYDTNKSPMEIKIESPYLIKL